jgi:hypothetical protein
MGLLDARGGPGRIFGQEGPVKIGTEPGFAWRTDPLRSSPFRKIVSRWAAYKQPTGVVQETGGCLFFQPAQPTSARADSGLRKVYESTVNCALLFPFTVTLRRSHDVCINQRIDSLPCPALFSMFPGRLARFLHGRGFHQTATIGLRRLELRLDYAGGGSQWWRGEAGSG